jgi:transposase-like protein
LTVWTSGDICKRYSITRSNFAYWRRQPDFPAPLTYSKNQGGTWQADEVREWVAAFRSGDPRRREAARMLRRGATVSAVARNLGVDRKTVRRWREAAAA